MMIVKNILQKDPESEKAARARLFIVVLAAVILSKGPVLLTAFSFDDYAFTRGIDANGFTLFFQQGRYVLALVNYFVESTGVGINSLYFPLGILALLLHAIFVVYIFEFAGVARERFAWLAAAIMVAHPYSTEIYTYKLALAGYCIALFCCSVAMAALTGPRLSWKRYAVALLAILGMLFTYQSFLNYFAVLILFSVIFWAVEFRAQNSVVVADQRVERVGALIAVLLCGLAFFLVSIWMAKKLGISEITARGQFLKASQIPLRIDQAGDALRKFYWNEEAIFPHWLKLSIIVVSGVAVAYSISAFFSPLVKKSVTGNQLRLVSLLFAVVAIAPGSLGVILAFGDWWPVPRVVAQVAVICGFSFLLFSFALRRIKSRSLGFSVAALGLVIFTSFVFLSNQIFVDQGKINRWDSMKANRVIARLESDPKFLEIKNIYIDGGSWRYSEKLRTIEGDMNVSAFFPESSKISLIAESTGYRFEDANKEQIIIAQKYCAAHKSWPEKESIYIVDGLAIVCLGRLN